MEKLSSKSDLESSRKENVRRTLDKIHECASSMVLLANQWKEVEENFDSVENCMDDRTRELNSMEASIKEQLNELTEKEKQVNLAQEWLKVKFMEFDRLQDSVTGRYREVERKEEEFQVAQRIEIEERQREMEQLEKKVGDFDSVRRSLEKQLEDMEEKEKRFTLIERSIKEKCRELESKEEELGLREKVFKQSREEFELKVGRFKELQAKEKEYSICESKQREFEEFHKGMELKDKELREKLHQVELKEKQLKENKDLELKKRSCANEIQMDGKSLQIYLNKCYKDNDFLREEVASAFRVSLDPAKLVLEAMQGFYPPHLKKGDLEFEGDVARSNCIFLLEQLMKLSPEIKQVVKKEATKLAFTWITKMNHAPRQYLEVLGFLLLLASYGLASSFDADELCDYLLNVMTYNQAPELLRHLGLADKITGYIKSLLQSNHHLEAVRFIYAFELVAKSSPSTLLPYTNDGLDNLNLENTLIRKQSGLKRPWTEVSAETTLASDKMSKKRPATSASLKMREKRHAKRQKGADSQEKLLGSAITAGSTPHFSKPTKEKTLLVIPAPLPARAPTTKGASSSRALKKTQARPLLPESGRPENQGGRSSSGSQKQAGKKAEEHPYFKRHIALMKKYYESEKKENVLVSKKRSQANWANFAEEMIIQAGIVMMRAREEMIEAAKVVNQNKRKAVELAKKVEEFLSSAEDLKKLAEHRKVAQEEAEARLSVVEQELASTRHELSVKTATYDQNYRELIVAKSEVASCKSEVAKLQMELSTAKSSAIEEFMASDSYRDLLNEEYAAAESDYREMIAGAGLDLASLDAYILSQGEVSQDASIEHPAEQGTGPTEADQVTAIGASDQGTPAKPGASAK